MQEWWSIHTLNARGKNITPFSLSSPKWVLPYNWRYVPGRGGGVGVWGGCLKKFCAWEKLWLTQERSLKLNFARKFSPSHWKIDTCFVTPCLPAQVPAEDLIWISKKKLTRYKNTLFFSSAWASIFGEDGSHSLSSVVSNCVKDASQKVGPDRQILARSIPRRLRRTRMAGRSRTRRRTDAWSTNQCLVNFQWISLFLCVQHVTGKFAGPPFILPKMHEIHQNVM